MCVLHVYCVYFVCVVRICLLAWLSKGPRCNAQQVLLSLPWARIFTYITADNPASQTSCTRGKLALARKICMCVCACVCVRVRACVVCMHVHACAYVCKCSITPPGLTVSLVLASLLPKLFVPWHLHSPSWSLLTKVSVNWPLLLIKTTSSSVISLHKPNPKLVLWMRDN